MTGTASFYPTATVTAGQLGLAQGAAPPAGDLLSRTSDPAGALGGFGLVASGSPVLYTVTVTWDSSRQDIYSRVVET